METEQSNDREFRTAREVVKLLRLDENRKTGMDGGLRALHRLRRKYDIPTVKIGNNHLFSRDAVDELIEQCRVESEQ